ncbi:MAG: 3-dehydroquinate synthase [Myxococcales bacterium]|nr:3-dehydroquinate synthase [Myxococcales bacterium]
MNRVDLPVELGERRYAVHVRRDALPELIERTAACASTGRVIVITDETVAALHAGPFAEGLRARGLHAPVLAVPAGEAHKTLATVSHLYDRCLAEGVDRHTPIVALGGGVIGDLGGFVAATLLRGLPLIQAPTTVLAQVDSSVGGKTGVNLPHGKNLVGAFHQPAFVFADVAWLATLDARDRRAGLAEAIKHAALAAPALLDRIARDAAGLIAGDPAALLPIIADAIAIKARIVAADEREAGARKLLNLGHTLGHAIEAAEGYGELRHGEAIALGLRVAARLSRAQLGLPAEHVARLDAALDACGLPGDWRRHLRPEVFARVARDKKIRGEWVDTILLRHLGDPTVVPQPITGFIEAVTALGDDPAQEENR